MSLRRPKCPACGGSYVHPAISALATANVIVGIATGSFAIWLGGIAILVAIEILRPLADKEKYMAEITKKVRYARDEREALWRK